MSFCKKAFTLIELLVVIAIIAILAAILLPVLAKTKQKAQNIQCMNNQKQLALSWTMYAGDFNDRLVINSDQSADYMGSASWCEGILDWSTRSDNTNIIFLTSAANLPPPGVASLAPYNFQNYRIYWCPSDIFLSPPETQLHWANRVRSLSMDAAIGDGSKYGGFGFSGQFWWAKKMGDLVAPGPSASWLFVDEHPDSIDDEILYSYYGYTNGTGVFTELPGSDHNGACGMSFADGHAEIHKWLDAETIHKVTYTTINQVNVVSSRDLAWIAQSTPRPSH